MGKLGLQLMQADPRGKVMNIQGAEDNSCKEGHDEPEDEQMDQWQSYFKFVASNIPADVNLVRVKEAMEKKTNLKEELLKIGKYWAQYANDLSLRDDCVWLDGRLVIPLPLQVPVESRIHYYHHGKRNMFEAARDVWYPYMYRSLAAKATYCQQCTEADETDPEMSTVAFPQHSNWEERSDLTYAPALRRAPITLDSDQQMDACPREVSEVAPQIQGSGDTGPNIQGSGGGRNL